MSEIEDLKTIRELGFERLRDTNSDHAFSEVARTLIATVRRIDEIKPEAGSSEKPAEESTVSEFEAKLAERMSGTAGPRRRASR